LGLGPDRRGVLGAAGVVIAALTKAGWEVFKFRAERRKDKNKGVGTTVSHSGQGPASGRDTRIGGDVVYGADGKQIGEAVAEAQRPLIDWVQRLSAENASLLRQLEEARQAPQAPGSELALAEAIYVAEKQAEAGQPRAEEALALLAAGKVAEAIPLFEAEAVEKKTASRASAKEAAAAYRNLGAIAGLADPRRALDAYEEAVALDPDDIQSLFWTGWIQIDYGDLLKAQTRLERVSKLAETGDQPFYETWALAGLGKIKQQRGDLAAALKSYSDSLAIRERLAKSDPGNAGWRRDLSVSYDNVGGVQKDQGDLAAALKSYSDSLAISERLAKSDPGNAGWQRDVAVSFAKLADAHKESGDKEKARDDLRQGQAIMARLTKLSPKNAAWK
jgi:tetratricopeptide (TPR) repeat protein